MYTVGSVETQIKIGVQCSTETAKMLEIVIVGPLCTIELVYYWYKILYYMQHAIVPSNQHGHCVFAL